MVTRTQATLEDLYNAPEDGKYELVDGRLVHMSPTGYRPTRVSGRIFLALERYEETTGSGVAVADNCGFVVRQPQLRTFSPDAAFILGAIQETDDFIEGAPTFAVEVRSKGDYGPAMDDKYAAKRAAYFAAGTRVVWDVNPRERIIASYRADAPDMPRRFYPSQTADAEPALPGWRVPVDEIFRSQ